MASPDAYEISLQLDDVRHLFVPPDFDPFAGRANKLPGIERILNELRPRFAGLPVRTTIMLPRTRIAADAEAACRDAVRRYCETRIPQITNELVLLRRRGIRALQIGLVFLGTCLVLSTVFDGLEQLPGFLRRLLGEGFLIAGWVGLWHPIDLLLYERWPPWRERRLHERLRDMTIEIRATD